MPRCLSQFFSNGDSSFLKRGLASNNRFFAYHIPMCILSRQSEKRFALAVLACLLAGCSGEKAGDPPQAVAQAKPEQETQHSTPAETETVDAEEAVDSPPTPTQPEPQAKPGTLLTWPPIPQDSRTLRDAGQQMAESLTQQYPGSPNALEVKARLHLLLGQTDAARKAWLKSLQLDPQYAYAQLGLGKVALLQADYQVAVSNLEKARQALPDLADAAHDLAQAYTNSGRVEQASGVLKEFAARHADSPQTWMLLGQAYQTLRQFDDARAAYEQALLLAPESPRAQQGLGTVLVRLGERERARELMQKQQQTRLAETRLTPADEQFLNEKRDFANRYTLAARVHTAAGNAQAAIATLTTAVQLDPKELDAWTLLIDLVSDAGSAPAAVDVARRMAASNEDNASCWYTLGGLQTQAGIIDQARVSFQRVRELTPLQSEGYEAGVRLNLQTSFDRVQTLALAQELVRVRGTANDHELLGQAFAISGQFEQAKAALEKAIELAPENQAYRAAMTQLQNYLKSRAVP